MSTDLLLPSASPFAFPFPSTAESRDSCISLRPSLPFPHKLLSFRAVEGPAFSSSVPPTMPKRSNPLPLTPPQPCHFNRHPSLSHNCVISTGAAQRRSGETRCSTHTITTVSFRPELRSGGAENPASPPTQSQPCHFDRSRAAAERRNPLPYHKPHISTPPYLPIQLPSTASYPSHPWSSLKGTPSHD